MSHRQVLADVRRAAVVRQVQEQEALMKLRVQQRAAADAEEALTASTRRHADSELAWAATLGSGSFDPMAAQLWRAHTQAALVEVRRDEETAALENEAVDRRRQAWATQLQLVEAVESVRSAAARRVGRADDERRLQAVEDAGHGRRRRP